MSNKRLAAPPPGIGQLTSLQAVDLRGNQLAAPPPEIGQLTSLQILGLGGNQLAALPTEPKVTYRFGLIGRTCPAGQAVATSAPRSPGAASQGH